MPINPKRYTLLNQSVPYNHKQASPQTHRHHVQDNVPFGGHASPLLTLPPESLTQITSFLDPNSLLTLARTHSLLYRHVKDDNTWHQAFACQFLAQGPESEVALNQAESLLLRRSEESWKKEFINRWALLHRWERSRSATVTHTPHYSPVVSMHLFSDRSHGPALLSSSIQYGVIARSLPMSGKVLKGYISATDHGLGVGNPNAEFSPSVSACAIATEGWSVKVAWGYLNGDVAMATANKVMDPGRTSSKLVRCEVNDAHNGRITDVVWVSKGTAFITAGSDGKVKIWEAKRVRCVWILNDLEDMVADPCLNVVADIDKGAVVVAKQSGTIVVWTDVSCIPVDVGDIQPRCSFPTLRVPALASVPSSDLAPKRVDKLFLDPSVSNGLLHLGLHYEDDSQFYRLTITSRTAEWTSETFGKSPSPLQTVQPFCSLGDDVRPVVITGDSLGYIAFFDWGSNGGASPHDRYPVEPFERLEAHNDGAITSVACNAYVLVTGSSRGTTKVWDSLTFRLLRSFPSPGVKPAVGQEWDCVSNLVLDRDLLLVSVGSKVMTWKAEVIKPHKTAKARLASKAKANSSAKWHKRLEMKQDISESRLSADEEHVIDQRSYERQRGQLATLYDLGLDEIEAVEYVLMLSRDEEEARVRSTDSQEGVFEDDFDDISTQHSASGSPIASDFRSMTTVWAPPSRATSTSNAWHQYGSPSHLNSWQSTSPVSTKITITPPLRPEPMEAGFSASPLGINTIGRGQSSCSPSQSVPGGGDGEEFPCINISSISSSVLSSRNVSATASPRTSPSTSMTWSTMVKSRSGNVSSSSLEGSSLNTRQSHHSISATSNSLQQRPQVSSSIGPSPPSGLPLQVHTGYSVLGTGVSEEEEDADLRLAIELSLVEALSAQHI